MAAVKAIIIINGPTLEAGAVIDATLIAADSMNRNSSVMRDPEMYQTRNGDQWRVGIKAHIEVYGDSVLVHILIGRAANAKKPEQTIRAIKCPLGFAEIRYKLLTESTAQLPMLFVLSNLW